MTSLDTQEKDSASAEQKKSLPARPADWEILPKSPLVAALEEMPPKDRAMILEDASELPRRAACCSRCEKALWLVLDRSLTCYCGRTGKMTWAPGSTGSSVETTMCDEVIVQAIRRQEEMRLEAAARGDAPTPQPTGNGSDSGETA